MRSSLCEVLRELRIRNLALIEQLELEFQDGLSVITGETGAGKSMLIDALELAFGGKAQASLIRQGADSAEVEVVFEGLAGSPTERWLEAVDLSTSDDAVLLRRVVSRQGRSRAYINGRQVTREQATQLAQQLADIASQHEHHMLASPSSHLRYLDAYAGTSEAREAYGAAFEAWRITQRKLAALDAATESRDRELDFLRFQVDEIDAGLGDLVDEQGMEDALRRQQHAARLVNELQSLSYSLEEADSAAVSTLHSAAQSLEKLAEIDPELQSWAGRLSDHAYGVADLARELGRYAGSLQMDGEALEALQDQADRLARMKRKYGGTLEAIRSYREEAATRRDTLENAESHRAELEAELDKQAARALKLGAKLSKARSASASTLSQRISETLQALGMGEAKVEVAVASESPPRLGATGIDQVAFLIAPNPGEALKPLHRIASGGELSRSLLAIKCVLAEVAQRSLYVFDEVDAGVGGGIGEVIGAKLAAIAQHQQVICITHLPQIAAFGHAHIHVSKSIVDGRTHSKAEQLDEGARREEVARMLGGLDITEATRALADELFAHGQGHVAAGPTAIDPTTTGPRRRGRPRMQ